MPFAFKRVLEEIASEKPPGPAASFSVIHLIRAMEIIAINTIGRNKLASFLGVGEGTVRTIVSRLKENGLIEISKAGCYLTSKGLRLWKEYQEVLPKKGELEKNELSLANFNVGILVKDCAEKIGSGIQQRDAAVMAGAKSATTILFKQERLTLPSVSQDVAKDFPKAANQITKLFQPKENDVVVIGSADTLRQAHYGTLAAAWTII